MQSFDRSRTHAMRRLIAWFSGVAMVMAVMPFAYAGQLGLGDPVVSGDTVTVPIVLQAEQSGEVSTLDFRVRYDPSQLRPVGAQAGPAAQNADKDVMSNERGAGEYSVVLMGLNRNIIADGEVASITFQRVGGGNAADVRITQTTFASPDALEIPSRGSSRTLNWDGSSSPSNSGQQESNASDSNSNPSGNQDSNQQPGQDQTASAQGGSTEGAPVAGGAGSVVGPGGAPMPPPSSTASTLDGAGEVVATETAEADAKGSPSTSTDAQRQLRSAIASADAAREGVDALAESNSPGSATSGSDASPRGAQASASADGAGAQEVQTVDATIRLSQAQEPSGQADSSATPASGGQQPRGLPETVGNPSMVPILIMGAVALLAIGGLFFVRKKLFS